MPGVLVDYAAGGEPIGLEITAPGQVTVEEVNAVLEKLGLTVMGPEELAPLSGCIAVGQAISYREVRPR